MGKIVRGLGWLMAAALVSVTAVAGAAPVSVREQIESSLLVTGTVDIEPNGSVSAIQMDHEEKLPTGVVTFVRDSGLQWRFEPIVRDGKAVKARAPMSVRVVAKKVAGDQYQIRLAGVNFDRYDSEDPGIVRSLKMDPPRYPDKAVQAGASGSVYLVVKVGPDGKVQDAVAEQVNLRILGSESELRLLREVLAKSALSATKNWSFRVPTEGEQAAKAFWNVRVPVSYSLDRQPSEGQDRDYGKWISYIPGPRQKAPWVDDDEAAGFSPDTLGDGGVYMANSNGPRLLTPLQGG